MGRGGSLGATTRCTTTSSRRFGPILSVIVAVVWGHLQRECPTETGKSKGKGKDGGRAKCQGSFKGSVKGGMSGKGSGKAGGKGSWGAGVKGPGGYQGIC